MESCSSAWGREGLSQARSSSQPWEGAVGTLGEVWGPCRNRGWHSQAAGHGHRAHPSLPAPSGHSGKGSGQAAPAPASSQPSPEPNPGQAAPKPEPGAVTGAGDTHLSKNPSANIVNRMENLRRTVNMGRLQEKGAAQ